jgi:hypothetical protein
MFQIIHEILTKEPLIGKTLLLSDYKNSSNDRSLNLTPFKVYSSSATYWDTTYIDWILLWFSSVPPGKCSDNISITLGIFPFRSFQIYSPSILPLTPNSVLSKSSNHWRHKILGNSVVYYRFKIIIIIIIIIIILLILNLLQNRECFMKYNKFMQINLLSLLAGSYCCLIFIQVYACLFVYNHLYTAHGCSMTAHAF